MGPYKLAMTLRNCDRRLATEEPTEIELFNRTIASYKLHNKVPPFGSANVSNKMSPIIALCHQKPEIKSKIVPRKDAELPKTLSDDLIFRLAAVAVQRKWLHL